MLIGHLANNGLLSRHFIMLIGRKAKNGDLSQPMILIKMIQFTCQNNFEIT